LPPPVPSSTTPGNGGDLHQAAADALALDGRSWPGAPQLVLLLRDATLGLHTDSGPASSEALFSRWTSAASASDRLVLEDFFAERSLLQLGSPSEVELDLLERLTPLAHSSSFGGSLLELATNLTSRLRPVPIPLLSTQQEPSREAADFALWMELIVAHLNKLPL